MSLHKKYGFTKAELDIARSTELPGLLSCLGYTVKRVGSYYTTAEMDSIRIRIRDPTKWRRYSSGEGGDAIAFLQAICGRSFKESVEYLLAFCGRAKDKPDPVFKLPPTREKAPFILPPAHMDQRRVFAYLRKRGVSAQIIRSFIASGLLYEDAEYHNCVFVGRDSSGCPRFASKRGTCDLGGSGFKGDVAGSDKSIGFRLPCNPEINEVRVFEAPIDVMSFCTLFTLPLANAVALCGLYSGPLDTYLRENPHLKRITFLLDNDQYGNKAAREFREIYQERGYEVEVRVPEYGKDWNEQLQCEQAEEIQKKRKVQSSMANLEELISNKNAADARRQEQQQAYKETAAVIREAAVIQITSEPEQFSRYLTMQGDNLAYSAGNIALAMIQLPEATVIHSRGYWETQGRSVLDTELENGASIFSRSSTGRGYELSSVYDITQTQGQELRKIQLQDNTATMEAALTVLLNFAPVQVLADENLPVAAHYDPENLTLAINPNISDSQAFAAIAAEIAHARFHSWGFNTDYSREGSELSAQSVSYILCRRFGIERELPDLSGLAERFQGWEVQERLDALKSIQGMSRQFGRSIKKALSPPQRESPLRHDHTR